VLPFGGPSKGSISGQFRPVDDSLARSLWQPISKGLVGKLASNEAANHLRGSGICRARNVHLAERRQLVEPWRLNKWAARHAGWSCTANGEPARLSIGGQLGGVRTRGTGRESSCNGLNDLRNFCAQRRPVGRARRLQGLPASPAERQSLAG